MPETTMKMPALAVVGPDHRIIQSTETFRRRYEDTETLCEQPEIDRVLTGHADVATLNVGDVSVAIEAVTDATGRRQAMLTLPPIEPAPAPEPPVNALREAAEASPAIVWVKDLDGRYIYANPRYTGAFGTTEERLRGNTDTDLPESETVDGPRLRYAEDGLEEPLQLEYTVPAVDTRPALAAFRFALRDDTGRPIGTCGVAAPVSEARVARDEAVRLMQLERWNRLDPVDVRAELLEQWHVQAASPRVEEAEAAEAPVDETPQPRPELPSPETEPATAASSESDVETSRPYEPTAAPTPAPLPPSAAPSLAETAELLKADLQLARNWADRADQLRDELQQAQAQIRKAEGDAQQALAAAVRASEEADRWRSELEQTRLELERAQAEAEALRGPSAEALRLSEELGRAVAAERERGDELEQTLARLRARLTDFESALERGPAPAPRTL
jgi:PAS domain S-box-containing protein